MSSSVQIISLIFTIVFLVFLFTDLVQQKSLLLLARSVTSFKAKQRHPDLHGDERQKKWPLERTDPENFGQTSNLRGRHYL